MESQNFQVIADTLWVLIAAFLVFFMNTGFGCVEAGFCRAKNATNILGKNFVVFAISSLVFWAVGWTLMFGSGNSLVGLNGWFLSGSDNSPSTVVLTDVVKEDVKKQFSLDFDKDAKKHKKLIETIVAKTDPSTITEASFIEVPNKDDPEKKDKVYRVSVSVPEHGTFVKEYNANDFYWGSYSSISWSGIPLLAKFFFQLAFAATAATIVSGCVAERIHYGSFMIFAVFIAAFSYPITGHWIWGGGWLANFSDSIGFWDFAGSTVVHSVGGWAGLAGIILLGPRLGKYRPSGAVQPIPGHSMALAFLGGMILWLGWFGFNPGSTMAADPGSISHIVITTNLACAAGMLAATVLAWLLLGKPDFSMTVNGALAGLVAITAPCAWVTIPFAILIGLVGGILVVLAVVGFDKIKIDDPVGALSVHLVNGIWGTLAIGLFADPVAVGYGDAGPAAGLFVGGSASQLIVQLIGVLTVGAFTFVGSFIVWAIIKYTVGIRVSEEVEVQGLDITEMGMEAYNGFQVADPTEYTVLTLEPRAAKMPPEGKRFSVVIEGTENGDLRHAWSELCTPKEKVSEDFKAIYPHLTVMEGNRFRFRSGEPEAVRTHLETLLRGSLNKPVEARVEE